MKKMTKSNTKGRHLLTLFRLFVDDENHGDREGSSLPLFFLTIGALNVVMLFS
jgi:hypothetical protein